MKHLLGPVLLVLALLAFACGDDDRGPADPDGGGDGGNTFTALIDGVAWKSDTDSIRVTGSDTPTRDGTLRISGATPAPGTSIALDLSFVSGPGSYPLGVNTMVAGGQGTVVLGTASWATPQSGAAGFVDITARTDTRIAGTFYFSAQTLPPADPDTIAVTNGAFDITAEAGLPPLPTDRGSVVAAEIDGSFWYAASITGALFAEAFHISATNTVYGITIASQAPVAAGNTYGIPSHVQVVVHGEGDMRWWGGTGANVGTIIIEQMSDNRVVATFSADLVPALAATTPMSITGGLIDVYLPSY